VTVSAEVAQPAGPSVGCAEDAEGFVLVDGAAAEVLVGEVGVMLSVGRADAEADGLVEAVEDTAPVVGALALVHAATRTSGSRTSADARSELIGSVDAQVGAVGHVVLAGRGRR
jgi:hypothetical protein